jgi:hypothetical protein
VALKPLGGRIITRTEEESIAQRQQALIRELYWANALRLSPALSDRPGRIELLEALRGTEVSEAVALVHALQGALDGPGDVCEFGVAQGATSALIANEIRDTDRTLWLYDSFRGLSEPDAKDKLIDDIFGLGSMDRYAATMAYPVDAVLGRLADVGFPTERTRIVEGFLTADLAAEQLPEVLAFAYLDFDLYEPIGVGLDLLHGRCRAGSVIMVDDYGFFSSGPKTAVAEFLVAHPDAYELEEAHPGVGHFCLLRRTG